VAYFGYVEDTGRKSKGLSTARRGETPRNTREHTYKELQMIDYSMLIKSLKHLEAQYTNFLTIDSRTDLGVLEKEAIKESVIQRFETCYDTLWKTLKRYLIEELGLPEIPNSPKSLFRIAAENNLFKTNAEKWLRYADARIYTSPNYSEEKAEEALLLMHSFIPDAIDLLEKMTGSLWE